MAGAYNSAFLIAAAFSIVPNVIYVKLLTATICRWADHNKESLESMFHVGVPVMIALGLICMLATMAGASTVLPLLFGARYLAGVPALYILSLTLPIRFAHAPYSSLFISHENMVRKVRYLGLSGLIVILGCIILIPVFGMEGAAIATVIAELFALIAHIQGTARYIDGVTVSDTLKPEIVLNAFRHLVKPQPRQGEDGIRERTAS
jgi:O-antigen/teichoic acid export membrane protein